MITIEESKSISAQFARMLLVMIKKESWMYLLNNKTDQMVKDFYNGKYKPIFCKSCHQCTGFKKIIHLKRERR